MKNLQKCDGTFPESYIEKRAANGQSNCSFKSNLAVKKVVWSKVNICPLTPVANLAFGFKKVTTTPFFDLQLATENQAIKCQDTVFANRCEGDIYTVGNSQYNQDGVYIDVVKKQNCSEAIVSKLSFSKKNNTSIDTSFFCGTSINLNNNTYNQPGTYPKTFKNKLGCDSIVTLNLKLKFPKSTIDTTICEGKSYKIGVKEFTQTGNYQEVLQNKLGCDSTISLQLKVSRFDIVLPDSLTITEGKEATLNATSSEIQVTYEWSPPANLTCINCSKTIAKPSESVDYIVKATNKNACDATAKINIKVFKRGKVFIPTAFSPDDNGTNDVFTVFGNEGIDKILNYSIFDRWGNLIFNQKNILLNDSLAGWNGKYKDEKAQQGVYIYHIQIQWIVLLYMKRDEIPISILAVWKSGFHPVSYI